MIPSHSLRSALQRHDARRRQGIATVSLLVGAPEDAEAAWREWAAADRRETIPASGSDPLVAWWERAATSEAVLSGIWQRIAEAFQTDALTLRARFTQQTEHERSLFWQALTARDVASPLPAVARRVLDERPPALASDALQILAQPVEALPAAFVTLPALSTGVVLRLCAWALRVPALAIGVALTHDAYQRFLHEAPDTRERAVALEGILHLAPADEPAPTFDALLAEASHLCAHAGDSPEASDRARSAAERLLFAALEARASTRGLFRLNENAGFLMAERPVEVDLLCASRRVAVEVDGHFHFISPDDYRRDRRKDLALQEHGCLVLRFLAEDVPARLDEIVATVEGAVAHRA